MVRIYTTHTPPWSTKERGDTLVDIHIILTVRKRCDLSAAARRVVSAKRPKPEGPGAQGRNRTTDTRISSNPEPLASEAYSGEFVKPAIIGQRLSAGLSNPQGPPNESAAHRAQKVDAAAPPVNPDNGESFAADLKPHEICAGCSQGGKPGSPLLKRDWIHCACVADQNAATRGRS
jgi:hypothetical protein